MYQLSAYPKNISLQDGSQVEVRPVAPADKGPLLEFFLRVPEDDRHFLKHDVTSPKVIESWTEHADFRRALPLVALAEGRIVAEAVLTRGQHGAYAPIAGLRVVVDAAYRNRGVGTLLMRELCDIAADAELDCVKMELVADIQDDAIVAAERMAFYRAATIRELIRDRSGRRHDLAVMILPLGKWYEWSKF